MQTPNHDIDVPLLNLRGLTSDAGVSLDAATNQLEVPCETISDLLNTYLRKGIVEQIGQGHWRLVAKFRGTQSLYARCAALVRRGAANGRRTVTSRLRPLTHDKAVKL